VFDGNYDEYLAWKEKQNDPDRTVLQTQEIAPPAKPSPGKRKRRRKIAEGELRNNYYKENAPLKKRLGDVEANLAKLESEYRDLETYLATPESYNDMKEVTRKTRRHKELGTAIKQATEEREKLRREIELKKQAFERELKDIGNSLE
jgi:predicted RNase H-like nuclease (RuvC/YqgF family)